MKKILGALVYFVIILVVIITGMYIGNWYDVCKPIIIAHAPGLISENPGAFKGYILSALAGGAIMYYFLKYFEEKEDVDQ